MNEAAFVRDLRNYLLHYGVAPVIQTLNLHQIEEEGVTQHSIKLSAERLLEWPKWTKRSKDYLLSFVDRDGPTLKDDVTAYSDAMFELYSWFFTKRLLINNDQSALNRFRTGRSLDEQAQSNSSGES